MDFPRVQPSIDPVPNSPGIEGHGEGIEYCGEHYYYRTGKRIPKDRAVSLVHEGSYCGRQSGDKTWIIVIWDETDFIILDVAFWGIRETLHKFKGKNASECKAIVEEKDKGIQAIIDSMTTCIECQEKKVIILDEGQPNNICLTCYRKDK